ncbi:MAG: DUF4926 domain-containing protein [Microcystis sp. LE19-388.1G]|jgi:hypothetical protein|nr:DUF4926 domain-containing protein [Microcystis sp. LE19-388.1G]
MKMTYFQDTDTLYLEFNTIFKKGDQGTIVEYLPPNEQQSEAGYLLEMFDNNETLDVIAVPISWITSIN